MESAAATNVKAATPSPLWRRVLFRLVTICIAVLCVGWLTRHVLGALNHGQGPAGFFHGIVQGALMPTAFPNLLIGDDVVIFAANNTGVSYKLGYTLGVNLCGALFFGLVFWRLTRWRKGRGT